jgi:hypothetical protein
MNLNKAEILNNYKNGRHSEFLCIFIECELGIETRNKFVKFLEEENILKRVEEYNTLESLFNEENTIPEQTFIFRVMVLNDFLNKLEANELE